MTTAKAKASGRAMQRWRVEAPVTVFVYAGTKDEAMGRAFRIVCGRYWFARGS